MRFVVKLYQKQVDSGRMFLHEQPAHAKSWMIPEIIRMMSQIGVTVVEADQCMYGLKTSGQDRKTTIHAKKPTKFMTSSRALGEELAKKRDGQHARQSLVDGRARHAAKYPPALCRAICREPRSKRKGMRLFEQ